MQLKPDTILQEGKYRIIRTLGQGGFGITYEAKQVNLDRVVAVKEFFMKDCCERDIDSSTISVPTQSNREIVAKFKGKFVREAKMIASFDHPHIVRIIDIFDENGTAYYVMENLPGGSLADKVKKDGPLTEAKAEEYIRQVADALAYIHSQDTVHLDVKPSNILLNAKGDAVLIDFGISKHYDTAGEQTSSTPVGISKGYAPLEQNRDGDVSQFKPSTDIYALGATLYYLVSGMTPPEASVVNEEGLDRPEGISDGMWMVIESAMQPKRKDRPQSVASFLKLLDEKTEPVSEETIVPTVPNVGSTQASKPDLDSASAQIGSAGEKKKNMLWALLACLIVAGIILGVVFGGKEKHQKELVTQVDTVAIVTDAEPESAPVSSTTTVSEQEAFGSVKVSSTPSGATIWLDGKNTQKTTPDILENLTPGKHNVKMALDGYEDYTGSITVTSDKRTELAKTLAAKQGLPQRESSHTVAQVSETPKEHSPQAMTSVTENIQEREQPPQATALAIDMPLDASVKISGTINGHEWVDLGLSVKWATCNVGASSPCDYGSSLAWGETRPKRKYEWTTYNWCNRSSSKLTKYNTDSSVGTVDNKAKLELSDDAAHSNWGGNWRMPTDAEWTELLANCAWTWTTQNGTYGCIMTSKINGNSIFLPAVVDRFGSRGYYWSSTLYTDLPRSAYSMYFSSDGVARTTRFRQNGQSIRPVIE